MLAKGPLALYARRLQDTEHLPVEQAENLVTIEIEPRVIRSRSNSTSELRALSLGAREEHFAFYHNACQIARSKVPDS